MRRVLFVFLAVLSMTVASNSRVRAQTPTEPLFSRHVVPVFSKLGCNSGGCHGMVQGRGGLRLSLFGADPSLDHERLLKEVAGRRVNVLEPDASLFLLKAAGQVPHEGGQRTALGSSDYQILRNWVTAGAKLDPVAKSNVKRMVVTPASQTAKPKDRIALKAQVEFVDGSTEDVTNLCFFEVGNREVADVDVHGNVEVLGVGDTSIIVRYPGQVGMATLVVTPAKAAANFPVVQEHNFIDKHVLNRLKVLDVHPSELCDDATFLRRVTLDVSGALPTADEVRAFLVDTKADKRSRKIDELLSRPRHAALWATRFMDILRVTGFTPGTFPPNTYEEYRAYEWLRSRLLENVAYDDMVERILTATSRDGRSLDEWAAEAAADMKDEINRQQPKTYSARKSLDVFWKRRMTTDVDHAIRVGHAFLGLRLQCAQCHRHPNDVWPQEDLLNFANFFMRVPHFTTMAGPRNKADAEVVAALKTKAKDLPAKGLQAIPKHFGDREIFVIKNKDLAEKTKKAGSSFFSSGAKSTGFATVTSPLGTQSSRQMRFLGDSEAVTANDDPVDRRAFVMTWMRRPENPFFAKAIVNRVWAHYLGRGIIDPPDDLSPLNPPSHPELLQELSAGFIENKYDLRWLHRTILNSRTYQQSSMTNASNRHDRRNFASFAIRRLSAEVLLDAYNQVAGVDVLFGKDRVPPAMPSGISLLEGASIFYRGDSSTTFALNTFGRPERDVEVVCDCERDDQATMLQALYLANHPQARKKISASEGQLARILQRHASMDQRITEIFLATVSRPPTPNEMKITQTHVQKAVSPQVGCEILLWSLLNSNDFIFNR